MTNPTPHGQVPEALIDLIDAYAETRHRCGGVYNAKTEAARKAVIEALSGMQALSAAPEAIAKLRHLYQNMVNGAVRDTASAKRIAEGLLAPAIEALERATPPAEQQSTKETSGGFHVWRDISTAPKDGSRFVATGHNYGLYSEVRHACVAQWFRGCWIEASDWNETSELKYLTHWMPLPPLPGNAASATADSVLEDAGGANWQDISTAPKDGTRFVAVGNNYGLYSEPQHTCIAQWFRGCWMDVSEWNETSELKYLTHWMPLLPLPGNAARKQGANHD